MDYSRIENVQFEDDEYYYYVKAIPKMTVAAPTKTVKRINVQRERAAEGRSVVTERTGAGRSNPYGNRRMDAKSITIGKRERISDFEELTDESEE